MSQRTLLPVLAILLSNYALTCCLDLDKHHLTQIVVEEIANLENRKIVKRVVSRPSAWQKHSESREDSSTEQSGFKGSTDELWTQNNEHSNGFYQQSPITVHNSKLDHSLGHNKYNDQVYHDVQEEDWYESVSSESTKSRKEKLQPRPVKDKAQFVAIYDPILGLHCPSPDATGYFVYSLDCRFYVHCWNGRAFLQPCAPGTLFSPDTFECDFPDKVECYMDESTRLYTPLDDTVAIVLNQPIFQAIKCPPHINGLVAHPTDCTKYLQCSHGNTYIFDCGPDRTFNPLLNICDSPENVEHCQVGKNVKLAHNSEQVPEKIECPLGISGLVPHPQLCTKFLQCINGQTYVMDCGPGTVFNPLTNVCDWPYNVPNCIDGEYVITSKQDVINSSDYQPSDYVHEQQWTFSGNHDGIQKNQENYNQVRNQNNNRENLRTPVNYDHGSFSNNYDQRGLNAVVQTNNEFDERRSNTYNSNINKWVPAYNGVTNANHDIYQRHSIIKNENDRSSKKEVLSESYNTMRIPSANHDIHQGRFVTKNESGRSLKKELSKSYNITKIPSTQTHSSPRHQNLSHNSVFPDEQNITMPLENVFDSNYLPTVLIELEKDSNLSLPISNEKPRWNYKTSKSKFESIPMSNISSENRNSTVDLTNPEETNEYRPKIDIHNNAKNKSQNNESNIMRINGNKLNHTSPAKLTPFLNVEPSFPVHYSPPRSLVLRANSQLSCQDTPLSGQVIRLRGGASPSKGYVEVQGDQPGWGVVCDSHNGWSLKEAHVVCKQLGYRRGAAEVWQGRLQTSEVPKWVAANTVMCNGSETKFQFCKFTYSPECRMDRDAIGVRCMSDRIIYCNKGEVPYDGQCYHFAEADQGLSHIEAHNYCQGRNSRLLDIVNQSENDFISELLFQSHSHVDSIMTSGIGFSMFNLSVWMWEDSSATEFKFNKWWPTWLGDRKSPPYAGSRPVCIIMSRKFPCYKRPENNCKTEYFFWEVEDCASLNKGHAFICERPYNDIGCIYGNGNQYMGNTSMVSSGRECLLWSDPQVARFLLTKVPNRNVRDKLKSHNYCRNPNPNNETRPWCFTGPRGEYEYCDIPYCGRMLSKSAHLTGNCKQKYFECLPGECIPSSWVCDGEKDCTNGVDEIKCPNYLQFFNKVPKHKLDSYEVEKWLNTPVKTCALRCKEADFVCRSFTHQKNKNVCYLSDSNIGMTGALVTSTEHDYYEMREHVLDCSHMFICANKKCINYTKVCDGKNDCFDRSDEKVCTIENLDYAIRLSGANSSSEGRVDVKILGEWGQVCDDSFDMIDAIVICRELGFNLGALAVRPGGYYGNLDPPEAFMVDQLKCNGNESTIRECDFEGWGKHNCKPEEAVGVVCKTNIDTCQEGQWKCDNSPVCIPTPFICDEVTDCPDKSDESPIHCNAPFEIRLINGTSPMEGRVEIRHHGIWGTVCDDDFSNATAKVICRSLGFGGPAIVKKDGFFGPGSGPIWLDEVYCYGNETQLYQCEHNHWGRHNCDHNEDAGVLCTTDPITPDLMVTSDILTEIPEINVNDILPADCGKRLEDFDENDELINERVVRSSIALQGSYPWQASIRVRGHSKSSHWCGAVVLSPLHVLTAAHCLEGYNKGTYFVRAGDYNTEVDEGTEVEANIEDYYIHEDFRKGHRFNNDIAVVLLKSRGIPLGRNIMPICLPHENIEYSPGLNCTISGFGSNEPGLSTHSQLLRFGWVPILDQSICKADYVYGQESIKDGMVCAGHLNGGPDTCDGDSGGPLACLYNGTFTLYGLTSWGQHCGRANKPGVYVRIAHYRKWIDQKIKQSLNGR